MSISSKQILETIFISNFKDLVVVTAAEPLLAYLKLNNLSNSKSPQDIEPVLKQFLGTCMNNYWHSYGRKDDEFVVETFDALLRLNIVKGPFCLITWIEFISNQIYELFDYESAMPVLRTLNEADQEKVISDNFKMLYDMIVPKLLTNLKCTGTCNDEYDGNDFQG